MNSKSLRSVVLIAALAFGLAGCAGFDTSVFKGGLSLTATVQNPITREQQAAVEAAYNVAANAAVTYARLRRCGAGEMASATNWCSQWTVVQKLQSVNRKAYTALVKLRGFMDRNQTISAISAYNELQAALSDFRATALATGI